MDLSEALGALGFGRKIFAGEHEEYRRSLRKFFQTKIEPNVRQWERDGFFPRSIFEQAGQAGLLGAAIPPEYGGAGGDFLHHVILFEEHGYSTAGASLEAGLTSEVTGLGLLESGTELQKQEWLPPLCTGKIISDLALTESHSGSDPRSMLTHARREGDNYIINGSKMWISNAPILDMVVLVARMSNATSERPQFSAFLVDTKTPGVTVSKPTELMMRSAGGVGEFFFDNVRVGSDALLGGVEGRGLSSGLGNITIARLATAARMLAACELAFVQVKTEISVGRGYLDELLARALSGDVTITESAMAKLWISEMEARVMDECLQLFGGAGFSNEYPISKMYAFARVHRIYLGTSEIQKIAIARSFL